MYLKRLKINHFRNFDVENNIIEFVNSSEIQNETINVAAVTTLIVGKNNAGKTTIVTALDKLINKATNPIFCATDFNFSFLLKCMNSYKTKPDEIILPELEFILTIALEDGSKDLLTNLVPFMLLEDVEDSELEICIKYELVEVENYKTKLKDLFEKYDKSSNDILFRKYLKLLDTINFKLNYYDKNRQAVDKEFKIKNLMDLRMIRANIIKKDTSLSEAFSKIVKYRYEHICEGDKIDLEDSLDDINNDLDDKIKVSQTKSINEAVDKIVSTNAMKVNLHADITLEKVINSLIKYEYVENNLNIPENQFGLGYTNLMMIIAEILDYMEHYPNSETNNKINLISIEEPETFMHPQMQEVFIKSINDVIDELRTSRQKNINSQLVVTTHSPHILNSKIHSGNSFDNINYVYKKNNVANIAILNNQAIMPDDVADENCAEFKFLKKHIKYKVSELFFSDAVIFVEGFSEETILPFYIEQMGLKKHYISIFGINGAHAYLYRNLIKVLDVPALIITDLDIDKENDENSVTDLSNKTSTNNTIAFFWRTKDLSQIGDHFQEENIYVAYQWKIGMYYATSFEEAMILTNFDNKILNEILKKIKPRVYTQIVGENLEYNKNQEKSGLWQVKLTNDKSRFASEILYSLIENEKNPDLPEIPEYIRKGLEWLKNKLDEGC